MVYFADMAVAAVAAVLALAGPASPPAISFWNGLGQAQVYVMAADGTGVRRLTNLYSAKRAAWSPDGRRLAFDGRFYTTLFDFDIGIMRADGSHVRRVTRGPERDTMAAWSPDGRRLAFSRLRAENAEPDVWLVRPSGRDAHRLVRGSAPTWSPDGRWIAFDSHGLYTHGPENAHAVYVMRSDGTAKRRLTRGGDDWATSWARSPATGLRTRPRATPACRSDARAG